MPAQEWRNSGCLQGVFALIHGSINQSSILMILYCMEGSEGRDYSCSPLEHHSGLASSSIEHLSGLVSSPIKEIMRHSKIKMVLLSEDI